MSKPKSKRKKAIVTELQEAPVYPNYPKHQYGRWSEQENPEDKFIELFDDLDALDHGDDVAIYVLSGVKKLHRRTTVTLR